MVVDSGAGSKSAYTDSRADSKRIFRGSVVKKKGRENGQTSSGYDQRVAPVQLFWRADLDRL